MRSFQLFRRVFLVLGLTLIGCGARDEGAKHADEASATGGGALLRGLAVLPAATFAPGPTSGARIDAAAAHGLTVPFASQPVQGFSAILANADGSYLAMTDNGYGSLENSADFELRVYTVRPEFDGKEAGQVRVGAFFTLRDPDRKIPFAITNHFTESRVLTGADLDIESMQRAPDGTFWFGDEFGPSLVHTDAEGRVLEPPFALPDAERGGELRSPQNPKYEEAAVVRIMNALAADASKNHARHRPVFSPDHALLADDNPATFVASRETPPSGSGLVPASSEIVNVTSLHQAGFAVIPYTVNDATRMVELLKLKVDGLISDRPDLLRQTAFTFDGDGDGKPDFVGADGLLDVTKFDAQGHRGARNLRPENTLPAFEAALDHLVTTLEFDVGLTADGHPLLSHDPQLSAQKCRLSDGSAYDAANETIIFSQTLAQIQSRFVCDKLFRGPEQKNDPALSPVAVAYAALVHMPHVYAPPTLEAVLGLVDAYVLYYSTGAGKTHPEAALRAKSAARVRFNVETKTNPRAAFLPLTASPERFVDVIGGAIAKAGVSDRTTLQSFDFRSLREVHAKHAELRTVALFGDFPVFDDPSLPGSDRGTNLQPEAGRPSPWLAGLPWPYRSTKKDMPARVRASGGLEAMAISKDGARLFPLLEKPLVDIEGKSRALEFDIVRRSFTDKTWSYAFEPKGKTATDFVMFSADRGLVIERDDTQGDLSGLKHVYEVKLPASGGILEKRLAADLLRIADPRGLSTERLASSDVGVGPVFAMPFVTIESISVKDDRHVVIANDNNLPFSMGRHVASGKPDDTEFVILELARPLLP